VFDALKVEKFQLQSLLLVIWICHELERGELHHERFAGVELSSLCKLSRYKRSSRACKSITLLIFLSAVESILRSFIGRRRATRQGLLIFLKEFLFKHCDPFLVLATFIGSDRAIRHKYSYIIYRFPPV
jgi:hypothetical protein